VNTPIRGFLFDGCSIETTEQKTGEIWVFVSPGVKFINVKHKDYGSLRNYPFPESIKSGMTYEMKIYAEPIATPVQKKVVNQYLIVKCETPNAKIFINNEYKGKNTATAYLPVGVAHTYSVEAPLYHKTTENVVLQEEEKTTVDVKLEPAFGYLNIVSTPENGAEIEINGELQSQKTPFKTQALASGDYTLQAFMPNYTCQPMQVKVEDGKTTEVNVALIANFSKANIVCEDKDAEIYIDEEFKAVGSWSGVLSDGSHKLIARKGERVHKENIEIVRGVDYNLTIPEIGIVYGKLNVNSNPMEAEIFINGKSYGSTPNIISKIAVGTYTVELKKQDITLL
jgi:hypothetical protein